MAIQTADKSAVSHAADRQLSPTLWERVIVYDDGSEKLEMTGTLTEVLDYWLPLLIHERWTEIGCNCGQAHCPFPMRKLSQQRPDFIREFVELQAEMTAYATDLCLDAGGRSACGREQSDNIPGHAKKKLVRPDYWDEWAGKQCADCAALIKPQLEQQQQAILPIPDASFNEETQVAESYHIAAELLLARLNKEGYENLKVYPGIYKLAVDDRWQIECHSQHGETIELLPAYTLRVKFNGWLAGYIVPSGGVIAAGARANEDTFIAALRERLLVEFGKEV